MCRLLQLSFSGVSPSGPAITYLDRLLRKVLNIVFATYYKTFGRSVQNLILNEMA